MDRLNAKDALGEVELSEWFDWMRREITQGGVGLPDEETSVLFIARALHLAARVQHVYRHFLTDARRAFIESAIVHQCWQRQKVIQAKAKWPGARAAGGALLGIDAVRYIRPMDDSGRHHVMGASDGFSYVVTLSTGLWTETLPATEMICNAVASLMGLIVPVAALVAVAPRLLKLADAAKPGFRRATRRYTPDLCCGFRYTDSDAQVADAGAGEPRISKRNLKQLFGGLVFDIWTLNLSPRNQVLAHDPATCRLESILLDDSRCLAGSNWFEFCNSTFESIPSPQPAAARIRKWEQLEPWLNRIDHLDLNPLWEIVFQMPPNWYGHRRQHVTDVLCMLQRRASYMRKAVLHLARIGYFADLKTPSDRVNA